MRRDEDENKSAKTDGLDGGKGEKDAPATTAAGDCCSGVSSMSIDDFLTALVFFAPAPFPPVEHRL
jgi:hypothetical protein